MYIIVNEYSSTAVASRILNQHVNAENQASINKT
jgi:hypothetical protein